MSTTVAAVQDLIEDLTNTDLAGIGSEAKKLAPEDLCTMVRDYYTATLGSLELFTEAEAEKEAAEKEAADAKQEVVRLQEAAVEANKVASAAIDSLKQGSKVEIERLVKALADETARAKGLEAEVARLQEVARKIAEKEAETKAEAERILKAAQQAAEAKADAERKAAEAKADAERKAAEAKADAERKAAEEAAKKREVVTDPLDKKERLAFLVSKGMHKTKACSFVASPEVFERGLNMVGCTIKK